MEIHPAPHVHPNKKFTEYALEFLLIFLAVSAGFFAEKIRENQGERAKEKEYIGSFIKNLQDDTSRMREVIEFNTLEIKGLDSFLLLSKKDLTDPVNLESFYSLANRYFFNEQLFESNDATLVQLRNSGGYRLIQKDRVADSIALYDTRVHLIYEQGNYYLDYYKQIRGLLDEMADLTLGRQAQSFPQLLTDPAKTRLFFNKIFEFRIAVFSYCNSQVYIRGHLLYATRLIEFLKKEYDLE
ncbi:MAG TPA: hypothetical protein VGZ71_02500 [Puia sp.]|nr:hypothetical protein [Puia sp.]